VVTSCGNYYVTARRHPDNEAKTPRRCWTSAMLGRLGRFFKLSRQHKVVLTSFHPPPSRLFRFPPHLPNPTPCHLPTGPCSGPTPCVHSVPRRFLSGLASGCTNSYSISAQQQQQPPVLGYEVERCTQLTTGDRTFPLPDICPLATVRD